MKGKHTFNLVEGGEEGETPFNGKKCPRTEKKKRKGLPSITFKGGEKEEGRAGCCDRGGGNVKGGENRKRTASFYADGRRERKKKRETPVGRSSPKRKKEKGGQSNLPLLGGGKGGKNARAEKNDPRPLCREKRGRDGSRLPPQKEGEMIRRLISYILAAGKKGGKRRHTGIEKGKVTQGAPPSFTQRGKKGPRPEQQRKGLTWKGKRGEKGEKQALLLPFEIIGEEGGNGTTAF